MGIDHVLLGQSESGWVGWSRRDDVETDKREEE